MNLDQLNDEIKSDLETRYLLFNIDDMVYGVSLVLALEILTVQIATKIPNTNEALKGIINLRGKVVPVVDVRIKFGLEELEYTDKTCIIVLELDGMQIGLIVDSVREVATINESDMSNPPNGSGFSNKFLSSVTEVDGKIVLNIDFKRFFQDEIGSLI
ncbi:MAG: chemotaxis protein CheW [Clostridia bacterium]